MREGDAWRYIGHVGTGFTHRTLKELHRRLMPLKSAKSPFSVSVKDEAVTTWVKPALVARGEVHRMDKGRRNATPGISWPSNGQQAKDVVRERERDRLILFYPRYFRFRTLSRPSPSRVASLISP